jgi:hypothetical protein
MRGRSEQFVYTVNNFIREAIGKAYKFSCLEVDRLIVVKN